MRAPDPPIAVSPAVGSWQTSLGLALIIAGQPIAWFVRGFFNSDSVVFPAAMVLFGMALMLRPDILRRPVAYVDLRLWASYVLVFVLPVAVMSLVDPVYLLTDWSYGLFLFVLLIVLAITPPARLRLLPVALTIVGGLSCACPLIDLVRRPLVETVVRLALAGNGNTLIIGTIGGATMLAAAVTVRSREIGGWWSVPLCVGAFAVGAACVVLSNTRSVLLALVYGLPAAFILTPVAWRSAVRKGRRGSFVFIAGIVALAVAAPFGARMALGTQQLQAIVDYNLDRFAGAANLFGDSRYDKVDVSTQGRLDTIRATIDGITPLGAGISHQASVKQGARELAVYPHFTYLQVFYDLGIGGALIYTILHLVVPMYLIIVRWRRGVPDGRCAFVMVYYLYSQIDHFTHATPYSWLTSLPVALIYVMLFPAEERTWHARPIGRAVVAA